MGACRIITSWPLDSGIGSGVAAVAQSLQKALRESGVPAELLAGDYPSAGYLATSARRVLFNYRLPPSVAAGDGPLITFDFDGFALPASAGFVSINQGILGDIVRFETGMVRQAVRLMASLEARAARKARKVFVPSRFAAQTLCALYGISPHKVVVMPNGIFTDEWDGLLERAPALPHRAPTVLCVARLYRRKGVEALVRAWPRVLAAHPDAVLRIAGDGLEHARLNALVEELRLGDSVLFEGDVTSREALAALYANCDLFCLPSKQETFGLVFLEAMAAGKPVVAFAAAAVPEVVRSGVDGLLVNDGSELASAIVSLLRDGQMRERMGRSGRERVLKEYEWHTVVEPLVDHLRRW